MCIRDSINIIGHSLGGQVAAYVASERTELINNLIMIDTFIRPPGYDPKDHESGPLRMIKYYPDKVSILKRFRLLPSQECLNGWFVRYIAEHSIKETEEGWRWKFDDAMFNGLERSYSNQEARITLIKNDWKAKKDELDNIEIRLAEINERTIEQIEEEYNIKLNELNEEKINQKSDKSIYTKINSTKEKSPYRSELISQTKNQLIERISSGYKELDRVLGGGLVPGSLVLIGGDPGIGKSTLILQSATAMAHERSVLYVAAEESAEQVKLRWNRIADHDSNLHLLAETCLLYTSPSPRDS